MCVSARSPVGEGHRRSRHGAPKRDGSFEVPSAEADRHLGSERLDPQRDRLRIANKRNSVTLVHKVNIIEFHRRAFRYWATRFAKTSTARSRSNGGPCAGFPWQNPAAGLASRTRLPKNHPKTSTGERVRHHAQQCLTRQKIRLDRHAESERRLPVRFARGAGRRDRDRACGNSRRQPGHPLFEATPGPLPKYADQTRSILLGDSLSGDALRHLKLDEAADLGWEGHGRLHRRAAVNLRLRPPDGEAKELNRRNAADAMIKHMYTATGCAEATRES